MKKLNFGCGSIQPEGWINVDHDTQFNALPHLNNIEDGSLDIIVAHAVIQQIPLHSLVNVLTMLKRRLKVDGVLRISLPDIMQGVEAYHRNEKEWFPNGEEDIDDRFSAWITWYSTSCTLLTSNALFHKLKEAGFSKINIVDFKKTKFDDKWESTELDTRENEFYFIEAMK
jgi:predicted SAM-dependent methyltransferase